MMATRSSRTKINQTTLKTTKSASTSAAHRKKIIGSSDSASESTADENIENIPIMNIRRTTRITATKQSTTAISTPSTRTTRRRQRQLSESDFYASDSSVTPSVDVTPPKVRKPTKPSKDLHTPTKLLNRMSIDERSKVDESDDEAISPSQSALQSAKKSLNNGRIQNLPGREKELGELTGFFTDSLRTKSAASMYISGPPGTGKTACLSKLLQMKQFANAFKTVYLNCTGIASIGGIYKQICSEFGVRTSTEKENVLKIRKYLTESPKMILMVLDEIDQLVGQKKTVLYTIFEWPALADSKLILIGIANSLDLTDRQLSRLNAKCELRPKLMHFAPYTKQQIVDIFKSRLDESGMQNVFPAMTIQLLAAKVAAVSGDVRRALDIGRRVIEMAEANHDLDLNDLGVADLEAAATASKPVEKVELKQVMSVLNDVYGASQNLMVEIEDAYPLQQKIVICSLLLLLKRSKNKDITMGRLHGVFTRICTKRHIDAVGQAEFMSMCMLVETRGIISIVAKKEPRLSKVQLQWDEQEVTAALQDKQLIASILADTTISIQ